MTEENKNEEYLFDIKVPAEVVSYNDKELPDKVDRKIYDNEVYKYLNLRDDVLDLVGYIRLMGQMTETLMLDVSAAVESLSIKGSKDDRKISNSLYHHADRLSGALYQAAQVAEDVYRSCHVIEDDNDE